MTFVSEKRQTLTKAVLLSWALRFMHCAECKCSLSNGFHDDHIQPLSMGGSNDVLNRQPLCKSCHKQKTIREASIRAKAKRMAGETGQYARRKRKGPQMKSRGFDKRLRKRMDGTVVPRDQNQSRT